jgi:hypothetical protein
MTMNHRLSQDEEMRNAQTPQMSRKTRTTNLKKRAKIAPVLTTMTPTEWK